MLAGELYRFQGEELATDHRKACAWMDRYNQLHDLTYKDRQALLKELLRTVGDRTFVKAPFYCDYGFNISLGRDVLLNYKCVILDQAPVTIGDHTRIGPGVHISTADHPRDAKQRLDGWEFARPVHIGSNVWIGSGAQILPGVTVGDHAIIGSGSVVTRDVPKRVTVVGNPARPLAPRSDA